MNLKQLFQVVAVAGGLGVADSAQAVSLDLQAGGTGFVNTAYFITTDRQSTGTGVIAPFLRIQNSPTEQGYNTSAGSVPYDDKAGSWTHDLLLADVPVVTIGGIAYREFLLDINETKSDPQISLESLQIAMGNTASPTGAWNTAAAVGANVFGSFGKKVFDMDIGSDGNSSVLLNYSLNSGSGSGDLFAYVPNSLFTGGQYVYFYSAFGRSDSVFDSNAGFEEWAVRQATSSVPEPATLGLLGLGLAGVGFARRRKNA